MEDSLGRRVRWDHPCSLLMVRDSASGISEALGGALLDECAVDGLPTHRCWVYLDVARHSWRLPHNERLGHLADALGWAHDQPGSWLGPALITGRDLHWADHGPSMRATRVLMIENPGRVRGEPHDRAARLPSSAGPADRTPHSDRGGPPGTTPAAVVGAATDPAFVDPLRGPSRW